MSALIVFATQTQQSMVLPHMRAHVNMPAKEEAKRIWLSRLEDAHTWKKGVVSPAVIECEEEATTATTAVVQRMSEAVAKQKWLDAIDSAPTWRTTAAAIIKKKAEEEAKAAWFARLETHSWIKAAKAITDIAAQAASIAGEDVETLSREERPRRPG